MHFIRGLIRWLTGLWLHGALLLLIVSLCFSFLFGSKQAIKDILVESEVYNNFVSAVLEDNRKASNGQVSNLPLDDPTVEAAAMKAFSPETLKNSAEYFVDSTYAWLDGETETLQFTINLNAQKDQFIDEVSTYAANRLTILPNCTDEDVTNTIIFDLPCRPEGVPLTFIKQRVTEDLQSAELFKDITITEVDLPKNQRGKPLVDQVAFLPAINQAAKKYVWAFAGFFLLAAVAFVSARAPLRRGFKFLGRDLFSNGATFIVMTLIFGFFLPTLTNTLNVQGSATVQLLNKVTDVFVRHFDVLIINIGVQIVAVGLLILGIERISRSQSKYANLKKKSGLQVSSDQKSKPRAKKDSELPIQTSEAASRKRRGTNSKTQKYRRVRM